MPRSKLPTATCAPRPRLPLLLIEPRLEGRVPLVRVVRVDDHRVVEVLADLLDALPGALARLALAQALNVRGPLDRVRLALLRHLLPLLREVRVHLHERVPVLERVLAQRRRLRLGHRRPHHALHLVAVDRRPNPGLPEVTTLP